MSTIQDNVELISTLRWDPRLSNYDTSDRVGGDTMLYMPLYHYERLRTAAKHFNYDIRRSPLEDFATFHKFIIERVDVQKDATRRVADNEKLVDDATALRLRFALSPGGECDLIMAPAAPLPHSGIQKSFYPKTFDVQYPRLGPGFTWTVLVDTEATPSSDFTRYKTSRREHYDAARTRAQIPSYTALAEVLLHNTESLITEGSLTTVYLQRNGRWVTPSASSGANLGTTRRWALETGLCIEADVTLSELLESCNEPNQVTFCWLSNGLRGFNYGYIRTGTYDRERDE